MKFFKSIVLIAAFCCCNRLHAQQIKPLKIGDKVPDIVLANMLNHKGKSGKLSDFKGKAIIIDQWFIACAPCVGSMRHMDTLQNKFAADLIVLPVTFEKEKAVRDFWAENILVKGLKFTQVVADTLVRKYFPAVSFPQHVWINKDGLVVAITNGSSTNELNIQKLITDEPLNLDLKTDEMDASIRYAIDPNLNIRYPEQKKKIIFYSYFSNYRKEFEGMSRTSIDTVNSLVRVTYNNGSIFQLYDFAYANNSWEPRHLPSRFVRKDHNKLKSMVETDADSLNQFCYDLIYRGSNSKNLSQYMVPDLDKFFSIKSYEEIRDVPCYVISPNGVGTKYKNKYQTNREQYYTVSLYKAKRIIANDAWPWMLAPVINQTSDFLFLFEVPNTKRINFDLNWNPSDLNSMNEELKRFDLKIEKTTRKRKVIVLEDQEK